MLWSAVLVLLSVLSKGSAINKPVYKIILTQKGFTQFLQYDVDIPPLREFTFCTWIRLYDVDSEQTIFSYVVDGNNRVIRLWLDSGGHFMSITINGVTSHVAVNIVKDVWRHVCLSFQSDYGAWALYIDSRLIFCETSQNLYGFVIPPRGSIIVGYGAHDGKSSGLEGEIFGANMILMSTIERNYTVKNNPIYEQKSFEKNKVRGTKNNIEYVILKDLKIDNAPFNRDFDEENTATPSYFKNETKNYIKFKTPYTFVAHDIGIKSEPKKSNVVDISSEKEVLDILENEAIRTEHNKNNFNFWNFVNNAGHKGNFRVHQKRNEEQSGSGTHELPMISEYETPPPLSSPRQDNLEKKMRTEKLPVFESTYKINGEMTKPNSNIFDNQHNDLPETETPPAPAIDTKLYGQWTSSKFAGSVLNYLKSINFHNKEKKVPTTIPLTKLSDSFPYSSDLRVNIVKPPIQLKRKNLIIEKRFHAQNTNINPSLLKRLHIKKKRETKGKQINVQILKDDIRNDILVSHAKTQPQRVEVSVRGETKKHVDQRFYRNVDKQEFLGNSDLTKTKSFSNAVNKNHKLWNNFDFHKSNSLITVLPFLKSIEYFTDETETDRGKETNSNDMYFKSLDNANKWHNIKSYNNDYTPRRINTKLDEGKSEMDYKIADSNQRYPIIRLKYKPESNKLVENRDDKDILKGRQLAIAVSNQSDYNKDSISLIKYNHGFLPQHNNKRKTSNSVSSASKINLRSTKVNNKSDFNKHVKIGNALNEQHVIGYNDKQKQQSFIGGNEKIPDINKYRSDIDNITDHVPPSLNPRICKNVELYDRILYVQSDESIDMTHILSPIKKKNIGIEFIQQNYKKCSLDDSSLGRSSLLLLHWSRTPVRLFGGAHPKSTTDLCGFFK